MSLFRQKALDALSTPEKLDEPLALLRPGQWLLLVSLAGFTIAILLWSIFGRLTVRITGRGVLIRPDSLTLVQSEATGRIRELKVNVGDCVRHGQLLTLLDPVSQVAQQQEARMQLKQLISQDRSEDQLGQIRIQQLQAEINRVSGLTEVGALSKDEIDRRVQDLSSLKDSLEARNSQREQLITQQRARIQSLQEEIDKTAIVKSPINGCITDRNLHPGEVVQPGTTMFSIDSERDDQALQSLAYFPASDGKRLAVGQRVRITPTSTKPQRHGGIEGTVLSIRRLPINEDALVRRLGVQSLLDAVRTQNEGPLIEVTTSMRRDPSTKSGYDWGGGPGPDLKLTTGTPTEVRVLVEQRQPISYLIPILRDLSGLY